MKKEYKNNSVDTCISFPGFPIYNINNYKELYDMLKPGATCIIGLLGINKQYLDIISINIRLSGLLLKDVIYYITEKESIPILMFIKPNDGSYADNALKWGVAGLNISGGRIGDNIRFNQPAKAKKGTFNCSFNTNYQGQEVKGRFPANIILDEKSAKMLDEQSGILVSKYSKQKQKPNKKDSIFNLGDKGNYNRFIGDKGGASRFFYNTNTIQGLIDYLKKLTKMPNKNQIYIDYFNNIKKNEYIT